MCGASHQEVSIFSESPSVFTEKEEMRVSVLCSSPDRILAPVSRRPGEAMAGWGRYHRSNNTPINITGHFPGLSAELRGQVKACCQVSMPRQMNVVKLIVSSQLLVITPWPPAASDLAGGYEAEAEQSARRLGSGGQG